jgi:hypothetical protein
MGKQTLMDELNRRFGTALEAVAVSKDETKAFVLVFGGQQVGLADMTEFTKIGQYDVEYHGFDTYDRAFLIFLRKCGGDLQLIVDEKHSLGKLVRKTTDPKIPKFQLPKARVQDYLV